MTEPSRRDIASSRSSELTLTLRKMLLAALLLCSQWSAQDRAVFSQDQNESQPLIIQTTPVADLERFLTNERPIRRSALEAFIRSSDSIKMQAVHGPAEVQIVDAVYEASLASTRSLQGSGSIQFMHRGSVPALLSTPDFTPSLESLQWKDRNDPVIWGLGPRGQMVLLVPRTGTLEFKWEMRSTFSGAQRCQFELGLLSAVKTALVISSQGNWKPSIDGIEAKPHNTGSAEGLGYRFELSTKRKTTLQFENEPKKSARLSDCAVHQRSRYDLGRRGIDVSSELEIDAASGPITTLSLRVDKPLQIVRASMGDQPIQWIARQEGEESSLQLYFAPPLVDASRRIRLEARAPLPIEPMIALPMIRPTEAHWRDAEIELHVAPPLELIGLDLTQARVTDAGPVTSSRGGETRTFRLYSSSAEIRCGLRSGELHGKARYGARVSANENSFALSGEYRITADSGETFDLIAAIGAGWVIDSIESTPPGDIESWGISSAESRQTLALRLSRSLSTKSPLRFHINAHLPRVGNEILRSGVFQIANFDRIDLEAGFLRLSRDPGVSLAPLGDEAIRVEPASMSMEDLNLLGIGATDTTAVYSLRKEFDISHSAATPEFQVETTSETLVENEKALTRHRIIVDPLQRQVDRLSIRIFPATAAQVAFEIESSSTQRLTAELIKSDNRGDQWEIRFAEPVTQVTRLTAIEQANVLDRHVCRMSFCDGAKTHECMVRLLATSPRAWQVDAQNAVAVPSKLAPSKSIEELAVFHAFASENPRIVIKKISAPAQTGPWAWRQSRETIAGSGIDDQHELTLTMDGRSAEISSFELADESRLAGVYINGDEVRSYQLVGRELRIPLSRTRAEMTLQIRVLAPFSVDPLGIREVTWRGPRPKFTVLAQSWTIRSPPHTAIEVGDTSGRIRNCLALAQRGDPNESFNFTPASGSDSVSLSRTDWIATPIEVQENSPNVKLYAAGAWRLAGWCVLILVLLIVTSTLGLQRSSWVIASLTLIAAMGSIFAPNPYRLILSGVFLGAFLGLLMNSVMRARSTSLSTPAAPLSAVRAILLLTIILAQSAGLSAQSPVGADKKSKPALDRNVLDPVDAEGKPSGDFVYVSPSLFDEIEIAAPERDSQPCLLQAARYRVSRATTPESNSLLLAVEYTYICSADSSIVALPAFPKEVVIVHDSFYVDGESKAVVSGDRLPKQVQLLGEGNHTVRFNARIPSRVEGDSTIAVWRALRVPQQFLEVETDAVLSWNVDGVAVKHDPSTRLATIRLMPDRITQVSLRRETEMGHVQDVSLHDDVWFTISPGAISLEHLVRVAPNAGANSLLFELEEGVKLESIIGDNRRQITPVQVGERRWRAPIDAPIDDEATLRIAASMNISLASGKISTTGITFPGAKINSTRIAASASSDYLLEAEARPGVTAITPAELTQSWPPGRPAPQIALSVEPNRSWSFAVRPRPSQRSVRLETELLAHPGQIQIQVDAEISSGGEQASIYELRVPSRFQVESITVLEGAVNRLARFARTSPERITLFARTASTELRSIKLLGSLALDGADPVLIPSISVEQASVSSHTLKVFRGFDALAEVTLLKGMRSIDLKSFPGSQDSRIDRDHSRLIAVLDASTNGPSWEGLITVSPNRPVVTSESRVRFEAKDSKWRFEQSLSLKIESGMVDELQMELPGGMRDPISIEPNEPFRIVRVEGAGTRLVISPNQPCKDSCELTFRGDYLADSATSELIFRPMRPLNVNAAASWIAAPTRTSNGEFNWKGEKTEEVPAPAGEAFASAFRWFKQTQPDSYIQLQTAISSTSNSPRLDGQVALDEDQFAAVLTWRWPGSVSQEIAVMAPQGVRIIQSRIIGSSVRISQSNEQHLRLLPTVGAAPPTLEIVCRGPFRPNEPLPFPTIENAVVKNVVIAVDHSPNFDPSPSVASAGAEPGSALLARLQLLVQTKRDAQPVLATLSQTESSSWRRAWIASWDAVRGGLAKGADSGAGSDGSQTRWLSEADAERARIGQELAGVASEPAEDSIYAGHDLTWLTGKENASSQRQVSHFVSEGKPLTISFASRNSLSEATQTFRELSKRSPWLVPAAICGLLFILVMSSSPRRRTVAIRLAPIAAWIMVGTTWWIWLSPPWFGAVLAVAAILVSVIAYSKTSRPNFSNS